MPATSQINYEALRNAYNKDIAKNQHFLNKHLGEGEIDLSIDGWKFSTNTGTSAESILESLKFANPNGDLETMVAKFSSDVGFRPIDWGFNSIYVRGPNINSRIPTEVTQEASAYLSKDPDAQTEFLNEVHRQIVGDVGELYRERFLQRQGEIAQILNYFADKMRGKGLAKIATEVYSKVDGHFLNPHIELGADGGKADGWVDAF